MSVMQEKAMEGTLDAVSEVTKTRRPLSRSGLVWQRLKRMPRFWIGASIVALIIVCAAASNGVLPSGTPFQTFSGSVAGFLTDIFGVPTDIAACILTMCVSALALTSVDAVARIGRMSLQELFTPGPGEAMGPIQKLFTNTVFATILTLAMGYALCLAGYMSVWPLFGSANHLPYKRAGENGFQWL
jgi:carbon starvation protein CstA